MKKIHNSLTFLIVFPLKTFGLGKYDRFINFNVKQIKTDIIHCIHVMNNGASNLTESLLSKALFTKTVMIDVNLVNEMYE